MCLKSHRYILLLALLPAISFAQIIDNFSDSNFTANPSWGGDTNLFTVDQGELRSNSPIAATYYLSTPSAQAINAQWEFFINLKFSTSGANFVDVFLISDVSDITIPNNGYFVKIGTTADEISLYRVAGGIDSVIIDGPDGIVNSTSSNPFYIKVTRDTFHLWTLEYDDGALGTYVSAGSVTDSAFISSAFLGVMIEQSSAVSAVNNHFFDNFTVGSIPVDTFPPSLSGISVLSITQIDVVFSEFVEKTSAQTAVNYLVDNGIGSPLSAIRDTLDSTRVHLVFANQFGNGVTNTLTISNAADWLGNVITVPLSGSFMYFLADTAALFDIVINEIFADPSPPQGLPDAEFVELYNNSNKAFDLSGFTFSDALSGTTLSGKILAPGGYLILCANADTDYYKPYGAVAGLTNWPSLNNAGDDLSLRDSSGKLIHSVSYSDTWYKNSIKIQGGWTLEMIDPSNPCGESDNWAASVNPDGGTPGFKNSVFAGNPDIQLPKLAGAGAIDSLTVLLTFDETMDSLSAANASYSIDQGIIISTDSVITGKTVKLLLASQLQYNVIYTASVSGAYDCAGNAIGTGNTAVFVLPEQWLAGDLIINEMLFNPRGSGADFVEVYNRSAKYIDLNGWQLANLASDTLANFQTIATGPRVIFPGFYIVLTTDAANIKQEYPLSHEETFIQMTSLPSYSNDDGTVILVNNLLAVSDSITYSSGMQFALLNDVEGFSLERMDFNRPAGDKTNWHSAAEAVGFATPGYKNSQYNPAENADNEVAVIPEIFSPDNDGVDDVVNINYAFEAAGYVGSISIYDSKGRLVRDLVKNDLLGTKGAYSWDGINVTGEKARIGIYIVYFEVFGLQGEIKQYKKTCVLAGRL